MYLYMLPLKTESRESSAAHKEWLEKIELAEKKNKLRASYYNFYTDKGWGVASSYDLSIDSSILGSEETAIFIRDFIQKKDGLPKWEKKK